MGLKKGFWIVSFCMGVLVLGGCGSSKKLTAAQQENEALTQRVAELEEQLKQAEEPVYIVCEGDSLWGIAEKELGSGKRYKEIIALNPQLTDPESMKIGMKLKMPPGKPVDAKESEK